MKSGDLVRLPRPWGTGKLLQAACDANDPDRWFRDRYGQGWWVRVHVSREAQPVHGDLDVRYFGETEISPLAAA